jgi:hypothetical protein
MKHLKKYESISLKYSIGDYVLMSGETLELKINQPVKIIRILDWGDYIVMYNDGTTTALIDKYILRYLTPEEIEEYEIKLSQNKYNL